MPNAKKPAAKTDETPEAKPERKPRRPRIDSIINAILKGEYDDKLGELRGAIDQRNEARREDVLALVREVYGDDAEVMTEASLAKQVDRNASEPVAFDAESSETNLDRLEERSARRNPFTEKAEAEAENSGGIPETPAIVVRQPQAAGDQVMQEDGDGYVSRSPVIG